MEIDHRLNLILSLKNYLNRIKNQPSGPLYQSLNKYLAELYLESGREEDAIYHLIESQAVSMRRRTVDKIDHLSSKECQKTTLESKWLLQGNELQDSNFDDMMCRLRELPPEWTVVQLTAGYDPQQHMGNPCKVRVPPRLHISRLDLYSGRPYTVVVPLAARTAFQTGNFLENFQNELDYLKQQQATFKLENFTKYHLGKMETNARMQTAMSQVEMNWLKEWRCILSGQLVEEQLKHQLEEGLEKIVSTIKDWKKSEKIVNINILWQALVASNSLSEFEVKKIVTYVTGLDMKSAECKKISADICSLGKSVPDIGTAKRHPVILIVDDTLKRLPWEAVSVLKGHPVCRIHSLHFLHAMYKVYEQSVCEGVVEGVDPRKGQYIVNPDKNLPGMEERLKSALKSRLPAEWGGTFGVKPTPEQFGSALQESDIFVYCGHGSGTQFLGNRQIQKLRVNAVSLLFGCNSTGLTSFGARVETWSTAQCYMMSCSPCIVATLWNVTDVEIDRVCTSLLHCWLPPTTEMQNIVEGKQKQPLKMGANRAVEHEFDLMKRTSPDWEQEPKLLQAVSRGRAVSKLFMTYASVVAIGLPVRLQLPKS